jgi:hypothetical protein
MGIKNQTHPIDGIEISANMISASTLDYELLGFDGL